MFLFGFPYWVIKLITYPIFAKSNKKKKAKTKQKLNYDKLLESIDRIYKYSNDMKELKDRIKDLKESLSLDLYSRASDSYKDMMSILIKCSDGEGNLDMENFEDIINNAIKECNEVVRVAYNENENRVNEEKKIYVKNKKESIQSDLENMRNKNKEFKNMWKGEKG